MTKRIRFALPSVLLLALATGLLAIACSGNDDSSSGGGGGTATATSKADDSAKSNADSTKGVATNSAATKSDPTKANATSSGGGTTATGSDEEFVSGMCKAAKTFVTKLTEDMAKSPTPSASSTPSGSSTPGSLDDLGAFFEAFFGNLAPSFEQFAKDFKALKPPKDLAQWHADNAVKLDAAAKALKDGKFDDPALNDIGDNQFLEIPPAINDRLEKVAKNNKDCKDLDAFSSDSGGIFGGVGGDLGGSASATATPKKN